MNEITFMILKIVVSIAVALITGFIIPYIKKKLNAMQNEELLAVIKTAVYAAQQTIKDNGKKKEEVVMFMQKWLGEHKIEITMEQLDKLIESAVYAMKKG